MDKLRKIEIVNPEVARHFDFRDYLIAHPEEAEVYANLKQKLARQFPTDIDSYIGGKHDFIQMTIRKAQGWRCEGDKAP